MNLNRAIIPESKDVRDIKVPGYYYKKLDNGIKLFVVEDKRYPLITGRFVFEAGSFYDETIGKGKFGLSSILSELIAKGTEDLTHSEISEKIEYFGAGFSSGSDSDAAYLTLHSLSKYFPNVLELASKIITHPALSEVEFNKLVEHKINSIISYLDEGDFLSIKAFRNKIYKNTPYSNIPDGTIYSISKLKLEDTINFYKKYFVPDNLMVVLVGDINPSGSEELINKYFSNWQGSGVVKGSICSLDFPENIEVLLSNKKDAHQADICIGHKGVPKDTEDLINIIFLNTLLGGYFSSRINKVLREKEGLTYGSRSSFNTKKYSGDFSVDASVNQNNVSEAIDIIIKEINLMKNVKPTEEEIKNVKSYITGTFPMQLETPNGIAVKVINKIFYNLPDNFYSEYISKINNITPEDVLATADKYLHPDKFTISVSGDSKKITKQLEKFGTVQIIKQENYKKIYNEYKKR